MKTNSPLSLIILLSFFFSSTILLAQNSDEISLKLALEFYSNKEYDKSIELLEDLFKKDKSDRVYFPLINAYLATENYKEAEKKIKKQLVTNPNSPVYQVDYGYLFIRKGQEKKGEEIYKVAIKSLAPRTQDVIALSSSFQRRDQEEWAIENPCSR